MKALPGWIYFPARRSMEIRLSACTAIGSCWEYQYSGTKFYALVLELEDKLRLERSANRRAGASPVKGTSLRTLS
jgi:hypothetical protein